MGRIDSDREFSEELRLAGNISAINYVIGGYLFSRSILGNTFTHYGCKTAKAWEHWYSGAEQRYEQHLHQDFKPELRSLPAGQLEFRAAMEFDGRAAGNIRERTGRDFATCLDRRKWAAAGKFWGL